MSSEPVAVRVDATIQEAAVGMRDADAGALPVVADEGELVGIVTDRDLSVRALAEGLGAETTVDRVMTPGVTTVEPSDEIEDALSIMRNEQIRRLPVVRGGRLVGIVAQADLAAVSAAPELAEAVRDISEPAVAEAERRAETEG
ncbi:MAG: CBS domain-containing protein [Actinobacteria bacterium]|nr:CBS domain-containing protein [Actinomycetota bacterium]